MKNLFILTLLFLNFKSFSQYNNGKIQFNDGSELIGLIKITKGNDVKFKNDDDSKVKEYDKDLIKSFEFTENSILKKYIYSKTSHLNDEKSRSDKWNKLLKIVIDGKVKLYEYYISVHNSGHTSYYLKKESDDLPIFYYGEGYFYKQKFIPFVENYFSDCNSLVEKVKSKEIKQNAFKKVVEYYNSLCL